jgi:hypothetical protein
MLAPPDDTFVVIVTGSRDTTHDQDRYVWSKLDEVRAADRELFGDRPMVVRQGVCPYGGVDRAAARWAERTPGVTNDPYPADWRKGDQAGPLRNTAMVRPGAHLVLAFPGQFSRGTWDCLQKAVTAGIRPRLYPLHINCPAEEATRHAPAQ